MTTIKRGQIVDVDLNPTRGAETSKIRPCVVVTNDVYNARVPVIQVVPVTAWSVKKARIVTNVELLPTKSNGLTKKSVADCLQTKPINRQHRLVKIRGRVSPAALRKIDEALRIVFDLR